MESSSRKQAALCLVLLLVALLLPGVAKATSVSAPFPVPTPPATSQVPSDVIDEEDIMPTSDLRSPSRRITIITTASLPWMTGTAVNPLLRAAYLARDRPPGMVTLMVPWLQTSDQQVVFPNKMTFAEPEDQEAYIRDWLRHKAGMPREADLISIHFYASRYQPELGSIFPAGDVTQLIPDDEADALILEEPEHLNWYRAPDVPWTQKFKHVVGVCHTNYLVYSKSIQGGSMKAAMLFFLNQWMCRAYCHKVIKLSAALQKFAPGKEVVENVHGVREEFLEVGDRADPSKLEGAYFIGKLLWAKGLDRLFPLMQYVRAVNGRTFPIDIIGSGPDEKAIKKVVEQRDLPATFHGAMDHAKATKYKVFINPSVSEVLCTTIAEALAMGKFVVCADHPSNYFFKAFPNCLFFRSKDEFATNVLWALSHEPQKLTPQQREMLTWEAATRRLLQACMLSKDHEAHTNVDRALVSAHNWTLAGKRGKVVQHIAGGSGVIDDEHANTFHREWMERRRRRRLQEEGEEEEEDGEASGGESDSQMAELRTSEDGEAVDEEVETA